MPRRNKTGPEGQGPMTGRGLGDCNLENNDNQKEIKNIVKKPLLGRRLGIGRRSAKGLRNRGR